MYVVGQCKIADDQFVKIWLRYLTFINKYILSGYIFLPNLANDNLLLTNLITYEKVFIS